MTPSSTLTSPTAASDSRPPKVATPLSAEK
jgi:hypothetical protein